MTGFCVVRFEALIPEISPVRDDRLAAADAEAHADSTEGGEPVGASASQSSRPRKPRDSLNKAVIIDAALVIAERDGLDGLTFQALGDELGAHATSIYRHFRDKDEFLLEMLDTLRNRSYGDAIEPTGDWRQDVRLLAGHIRAHYLRYAQFAQQMSVRSTHRPIEFTNLELTLDALDRAGLTPDEAVVYTRLLGNYMRSMSSFEAAVTCLEPELRAKDRMQMQFGAQALAPDEFPHLVSVANSLLPLDDPRIFDIGLEAILDAIEKLGADRRTR